MSFAETWDRLAMEAHRNAVDKGFWESSRKLEMLADAHGMGDALRLMRSSQLRDLMHSELGEACEGDRKNLPSEKLPGFTNVEEEYADLVIRLMDASAALRLRVGEAVEAKMKYNAAREAMHGGKLF